MPHTSQKTGNNKRQRLIEAARHLIHRKGFHQTTLADIAQESGVPLGNVYYYFKTKDELAHTVVDIRRQEMREMFCEWEQRQQDPKKRLLLLLDMADEIRESNVNSGCPVGGLCQEMNKSNNQALKQKAGDNLCMMLVWITEQFTLLNHEHARDLALHLVTTLQGSILLANTLGDADILKSQIIRLRHWLDQL